MKVCPSCQSRFDHGETFCPSDGSKLVDAKQISPGKWADKTLADVVELGELVRSDAVGERYRGELLDGSQSVFVTIFNREAVPNADSMTGANALANVLGDELPHEILGVHSVDANHDEAPHVIEQLHGGRNLRTILDEYESLDWQTAVRIVARLSRAVHWMGERGYIHRGIHTGAIYVDGLDDDPTVQIGDWVQAYLTFVDEPLEYVADGSGLFGFAPYLSPEAIEGDRQLDERSLVYSLGMLLYDLVLGRPAFSSESSEETLKRHLHEQPLKIHIASDEENLHPELDDVLDMMWAKEPDDRFQTPSAAVAALASLLDTDPESLAKPLSPEAEPPFSEPATTPEREEAETLMGVGYRPPSQAESNPEPAPTGEVAAPEQSSPVASEQNESEGASNSEEVDRSGEVEIGDAAIEQTSEGSDGSADIPSIIIEDPAIQSAMGPEEDENGGDERSADGRNDSNASGSSFDTWSEGLQGGANAPSDSGVVTGFVDARTGVQHGPQGESSPVSVETEDITESGDDADHGERSMDASEGDDAAAAEDDPHSGGENRGPDEPTAELDLEEQIDEAANSQEKTVEVDLEEQIAKAKQELEEEREANAASEISKEEDVKESELSERPDSSSDEPTESKSDGEHPSDEPDVDAPAGAKAKPPAETQPPPGVEPPPEAASPPERDDTVDSPEEEAAQTNLGEEADASGELDGTTDAEEEADASGELDGADAEEEADASGELDGEDAEEEADASGELDDTDDGDEIEPLDADEVVILDDTTDGETQEQAQEEQTHQAETSQETASVPPEPSNDGEPPPPEPAARDDADHADESGARVGAAEVADDSDSSEERDIFDADGNVMVDGSDEWFQVSDSQAWFAADVREGVDRSEVIRRYLTWGFFALIATVALSLILFSQCYSPADLETDNAEQSASLTED